MDLDIGLHLKICKNNKVVTKRLSPWHDKQNKYILKAYKKLYEKKIWITRNPRDNIVRNYLFMWNNSYNAPKEKFRSSAENDAKKRKQPYKHPL
jgi:hypothetical protein